MSPSAPSRIFWISACREAEWRHISPQAILRFFFLASSPRRRISFVPPGIGGERLLHEHVDALLDGVFEVGRAERRMGGLDHHVARAAGSRWPCDRRRSRRIAAPAARRPARANCSLRALCDCVSRSSKTSAMAIELHRPGLGGEGVGRRPAAPPAAADQGQADRVVLARVGAGQHGAGQHGAGNQLSALARNSRRED